MKWYSTKNCNPPYIWRCLLRAKNGYYYVGFLSCCDEPSEWRKDDDKSIIYSPITHFCIIEPVEVEDE
jgi:hypothetical protein